MTISQTFLVFQDLDSPGRCCRIPVYGKAGVLSLEEEHQRGFGYFVSAMTQLTKIELGTGCGAVASTVPDQMVLELLELAYRKHVERFGDAG